MQPTDRADCLRDGLRDWRQVGMMRVLMSVPRLDKGGGIAAYARAVRKKFTVQVDFVERGSPLQEKGGVPAIIRLFKDYGAFVRLLRIQPYDLLHLNTSLRIVTILRDWPYILLAKRFSQMKILVFFHGWHPSLANRLGPVWPFLFSRTFGRADCIVVLASEFERQLRDWGYTGKIQLETTLVDDDLLQGVDEQVVLCRTGRAGGDLNILFLARVEKYKGVYEAVQAYYILKQKYPDIRLVIAGDGRELERLRVYVRASGLPGVTFLGHITGTQKAAAFRDADVYILPTHAEGLPLSVLEAMGFGLPVITRPVGGIKDIVENGIAGFVTESREPQVFAELLEKIILDAELRRKMGLHNYQCVQSELLASHVTKRLESIYLTVLQPMN